MVQNIDFDRERERLTRKAWGVTIAYILGLLVLGSLALFRETGINAFLDMRPNEVGDLLAGIAGPLAFIWLVYGYFLQGIAIRQQADELRQNTQMLDLQEKALQAQVEELRQSVSQQIELVQTSRQQLDFEREKHRAENERARKRAAPIFECYVSDPQEILVGRKTHLEEDKTLNLLLNNKGGDALDVTLTSSVGEISVDPKLLVVLKADESAEFSIVVPKDHSFDGTFFELRYSDIFNTRSINKYFLLYKRNHNGRITYEIEISTQEQQIFD